MRTEIACGLLLNDKETPPEIAVENDEADVVDEIGKVMGLTYEDDEPLRTGAKEEERDEHRWELDPASSDDYGERCAAVVTELPTKRSSRHARR